MKRLELPEVEHILSRPLAGNPELPQHVAASGAHYLLMFEDPEAFLSLIWWGVDVAEVLARKNATLVMLAERMVARNYTMEELAERNDWFRPCVAISRAFEYSRFDPLYVTIPTVREQRTGGTFYILDGLHRALSLAHRLVAKTIDYQPVTAVLSTQRASSLL